MSFYQSNPKGLKPGFVPRTHCPDCGADLAVHGMMVPGQARRCKLCHVAKAASPGRIDKMHDARWGRNRKVAAENKQRHEESMNDRK